MMKSKSQKVFKIVSRIPKGKVISYSLLAKLSGVKNPRVVGNILHKNDDPKNIPCHRVVHKDGSIAQNYAFGGKDVQKEILESENVPFIHDKVDMAKAEIRI